MEALYQGAENILRYVVEFSTLCLEFFGICILVFTAIKKVLQLMGYYCYPTNPLLL